MRRLSSQASSVSYLLVKATRSQIGCESNQEETCLGGELLTVGFRVSWVTLPTAVYYVRQRIQINSSPDRVLMPVLNRFMRRTTGAQTMFLILTRATKEFLQRLDENKNKTHRQFDTATFGRKLAPSLNRLEEIDSVPDMGNRITEAKILAHVTKALDLALELNC